MKDWEGITEFVYVAESESFTLAAQRLAISTAKVSRQVSALEGRLNVKLLYRTTRKVSLTQEGTLFYQHCRGVLDGLEAAERAVAQLQSHPQGKIKLTAPVTYAEKKVAPLINNFVIQNPKIEVNAYFTNRQVDLIDEGYDIAIRLGKLQYSTLMARKLADRRIHLCASPDYLEEHGTPHSLSELNRHNCLLGTLDYWRFNTREGEKNLRVKGSLRYNNGGALLDAALKGLGVVQLPDYYVEQYIAEGKLITLLSDLEDRDEGVYAVYPGNRYIAPKVRLLIDYLAEYLT
ncbi:LysR substrate-binding domain-containing protein [Microbulbifer sp. EKSA008]|uniref:LysR substrate-binding domain-containing protein n=1 Tax=Microbulbifer sp. EKSA008 TaxID=3243367 RepID=UPI00404110C9